MKKLLTSALVAFTLAAPAVASPNDRWGYFTHQGQTFQIYGTTCSYVEDRNHVIGGYYTCSASQVLSSGQTQRKTAVCTNKGILDHIPVCYHARNLQLYQIGSQTRLQNRQMGLSSSGRKCVVPVGSVVRSNQISVLSDYKYVRFQHNDCQFFVPVHSLTSL